MIAVDGISVRDARRADAPAIRRIALRAWPAAYTGLLDDEFIAAVLRDTYAVAPLEQAIARSEQCADAAFLVAERVGALQGFLEFGPGEQGPELFRMYVDVDAIGQGIGTALLDELHKRLPAGTRYAALVHADNHSALAFYRRRGFSVAGAVDGVTHFRRRHGLADAPHGGASDLLLERRVGNRG